jgi:transposase InsO family protein
MIFLVGRPSVKKDLIDTIHLIASSNPSWQATRILGELEKLGFNVSLNTVKKYLQVKRRNNPLGSDSTWKQFLELHKDVISAFDFFTIPTWNCKQLFLFFIIHHKNRMILSINATLHPTREWLQQQFKNAFYENVNLKYLIHDNDILFRSLDSFFLSNFQIKGIPTSFHSPWENGIAERFVRTIREELFNHVIVLNEAHASRLAKEYVHYYNTYRTHSYLGRDAPCNREVSLKQNSSSTLVSTPNVRGLHNVFHWDNNPKRRKAS